MGATSCPFVPIFKRFQEAWGNIDKKIFATGIDDPVIKKALENDIDRIKKFIEALKNDYQPRDDYLEFIELVKIFLGLIPSEETKFRKPGACHHARWLSKVIYVLKIYIFRDQFKLTRREEKALTEISIFIIKIYFEAWFNAPLALKAPNHDLNFLKKLRAYRDIDDKISKMTIKKFENHLWYLNEETVAIGFFDNEVSVEIKRKMVIALKNKEQDIEVDAENLEGKELDFFVSQKTKNFFERFEINTSFLDIDVSLWPENSDFCDGVEVVKNLRVVNDLAERGVNLAQEFTSVLTKNETQRQAIYQNVSEFRKKIVNCNKSTLIKS